MWVLFVYILSANGSVALQAVPGFKSKELCDGAVTSITENMQVPNPKISKAFCFYQGE